MAQPQHGGMRREDDLAVGMGVAKMLGQIGDHLGGGVAVEPLDLKIGADLLRDRFFDQFLRRLDDQDFLVVVGGGVFGLLGDDVGFTGGARRVAAVEV
ncbi:hypothetical protein M2323_003922 [Rhodoblastus acidophilus]|uniref:hypothetical protein n=1 Tax=Rhodoblastus acidophilus TaxID=1074 RepID=UPI0022250A1B|nr:hypothetical protein [Rhodoblastus acidophilus]MCW2286085.1 hypothetical protein [Rhodoblastus acidophilus]MCW2334979.1 hypothetical protein [Rhodoblastus acidophilus]